MLLSIICPVLDEEDVIAIFLENATPPIQQAVQLLGDDADYEIVFIDDGSTDKTAAVIAAHAQQNPRIKLIRFSRNFGKEAALAAGLWYAKGDAVIPIDVDLQDPPALIIEMVRLWQQGAQVVNAKRQNRSADSWMKRHTANMFYKSFNKIADYPITPNVGDFRLLDRVVVDTLNQLKEQNRFMKLMFSWVGFRQETVEYTRAVRAAGKTKFRYWKLWNYALDGITGATTTPLRIWTYIGVGVGFVAVLYALFVVVRTMLFGIDTPGYASLLVAVLLLGSFNLISLGIMGEYIGRISDQVKGRPLYIVREHIGIADDSAQP